MRLDTVRLMTTLALTLLMLPLASDAQQAAKLYRIGILSATSASAYAP